MMRALFLATLLIVLVSAPARADSRIGLSFDGKSWSETLSRPLFDPAIRWVPGDSRSASFLVRNQAESGAELRIEVRSADHDDLLSNDDIDLEARAAGGAWLPLENRATSKVLTSRALGVGDSVRVEVRANFEPASTNQSQRSEVALRFLVTLSQAGAGSGDGQGSDHGQGILPATGAPFGPWVVWVGAVLTGAGLALIRRSRRDGEVSDGQALG